MSTSLKVTDGEANLWIEVRGQFFEVRIYRFSRAASGSWWKWGIYTRSHRMLPSDPDAALIAGSTAKRWALAYRLALRACEKAAKKGGKR